MEKGVIELEKIYIMIGGRWGDRNFWKIEGRGSIYHLLERNVKNLGRDKVEKGTLSYNYDFETKIQGRNRG